jgi:hypothetical protein
LRSNARIPIGRRVLTGALALHLSLVAAVSLRELAWLIANHLTILPARWREPAQKLQDLTIAALGEELPPKNFYHAAVAGYLSFAGIQGGYGFFAPNVSDPYRLNFEFQFGDGHVERALPRVSSEEGALRLAGLLDEIGRTQVDVLRKALVKLLTVEAWSERPDARSVHAMFSSMKVSPPPDLGEQPAEQLLFTYEFTRASR